MKKIYFIRHAKSSWKEEGLNDFERPLNKRGKRDAPFMASRLKHFGVTPSRIITSPAIRAFKTAKKMAEILSYPKEEIILDNSLYESNFENYLNLIQSLDDTDNDIIIVAHNPEITEVTEILSDALIGNMPTCSILCIGFDVACFKEIDAHTGKVLFFDYPKKHYKK